MKKTLLKTITLLIVLVCSIGLFAACNKTLEELQNEYGIVVEGGGFKKGTTLVTKELDLSSDEAQTAIESVRNLNDVKGNVYVFDISALLDGAEVQPDGKVKVTMPAPGEGAIAYDVFHIKDSGACEKLVATYQDGKVSFETDSFSLFVLVEGKNEYKLAVNSGPGGSVEVNDENLMGLSYMGTIARGETVTLKAIKDEGYGFDAWYDIYGSVVSYSSEYTFTMDSDMYITAKYVGLVNVMFKAKDKEVLVAIEGNFEYNGEIHSHVQGMWEIGTEYTVKAIPNFGYMFLYWEIEGKEMGSDPVYHGVVNGFPGDEFLALAVFEKTDYCLQVKAIGGGKITENGEDVSTLYKKGFEEARSVTLTAIEDEGYHFVGWFDEEGTCLGTSDSYQINVDGKKKLEARFEKIVECTLTVTAGENGSVTAGYANGKKVVQGTSVTLNATPNFKYYFVGWFSGETKVSDNANYTFTVNEDTILVAKFEKRAPVKVSITITPEGGGYFELANGSTCTKIDEQMEIGTEIELKAVANFGYKFWYWAGVAADGTLYEPGTIDEEDPIGKNESTFTVPEDGLNISAVFVEIPNQLVVTVTEGGSIGEYLYNNTSVSFGEFNSKNAYKKAFESVTEVTMKVFTDDGYRFIGWFNEKNVCIGSDTLYMIKVEGKVTLEARFEKIVEYTLTATAGEGGIVTEDYVNGKKVEKGTSVTVSATPNNDYHFVGWYVGETKVSGEMRYTFTINEDTTLLAKFEKDDTPAKTYRFLCNVQGNGSIWENNANATETYQYGATLNEGTKITLTAKPDKYWQFKGWYQSDGTSLISTDATYTFELTDHTVVCAIFEEKPMISFLAQCDPYNGGYITENGQTVDFGNGRLVEPNTQITLTAVANNGYSFKGWGTCDGEWNLAILSTEATYTFTVTENIYVQAVFEEKPVGLKIDAHNAGFSYDDDGNLTVTVYKIGSEIKPNVDYVGVYATYASADKQDEYLTLDEDYTRDLGGLDFTKAGTYTVTYTYKADTSLTVSLTVQVVE